MSMNIRKYAISKKRLENKAFELISIRRGVQELRARQRLKSIYEHSISFTLNNQQRSVTTSYARETLVVAGAGTGKTSVLLGRAKFLVLDGRAKPSEILILAFNKKAQEEIRARAEQMDLPIVSRTFHGFGREILLDEAQTSGDTTSSNSSSIESTMDIAFNTDVKLDRFFREALASLAGTPLGETLRRFFAAELVPTYGHDEFETIDEYAQFVRNGIPITLNGERVKSHGEWLIANFLYSMGVPYEYERVYVGKTDQASFHKPDFAVRDDLYIEYFGIDRSGNTAPWIDSVKYGNDMKWKRDAHERNGSTLIPLYYYELKEGSLLEKLASELLRHSVAFKPRAMHELLYAANEVGYSSRLLKLLERFLGFYRAGDYQESLLASRKYLSRRERAFLSIFEFIYDAYLRELKTQGHLDFTGLILESTKVLNKDHDPLPYKYIMVDEFQDISQDRWNLIEALKNSMPNVDFTFVGDDWQAIYEFAGSDPAIMLRLGNFDRKRKQVFLETTFRMPQELCESTGEFVMKNSRQIPKELKSHSSEKTVEDSLFFHWDTDIDKSVPNVELIISRIGSDSTNLNSELFILARYQKSLPRLSEVDHLWAGPVRVSTIHSSKGLEADYVIILDVDSSGAGFPSSIKDDPLLDLVRDKDSSYKDAGERRVFYVAMTRARKQCHIASSLQAPSSFALEMRKDNIGIHLGFAEASVLSCPCCDTGRITTKAGANGSSCSNWPICAFQTPPCPFCHVPMSLRSGKPGDYTCQAHDTVTLQKCPKCTWGALVVKSGRNGNFLACHLWPSTGCKGKAAYNVSRDTSEAE